MGDFERVKAAASLRDFAEQHLDKSGGGMFCCPSCGSGTHGTRSSDGALSVTADGGHWECFSCHAQGDVFDLAAIVFRLSADDRAGQLRAVADWAGVTLEGGSSPNEPRKNADTARGNQGGEARAKREKPAQDYTEGRKLEAAYIESTRANVEQPEAVAYLSARGFTLDDARAAGIGYDVQRRRLILPWRGADWYHIDRAIDDDVTPKYRKPKSERVGSQPLYNPQAAAQPAYFIVEGVLDAIAVQLCGYEAVAVASNNMSERNLTELAAGIASRRGAGVAVLMLDNDERGREGGLKVAEAFKAAGIAHTWADVDDDAPRDAAEWYQVDKGGLRAFLAQRHEKAVKEAEELREAAYRDALGSFRVLNPADVAEGIFTLSEYEEPEPTGIKALDAVLEGGLRSGLYGLGAVSSMGKTTLTIQVADYMAERGRGVLFVTIEQSARELVAKSLSRIVRTDNDTGWNVISATEAVSKARRDSWNEAQLSTFLKACEHYAGKVAPRLKILEGTKQPSVSEIEAVARMMAEHDGRAPVIFIDYLQLLKPSGERDTDKQAIDKNVMALRQLARDMKTPVWVISSLNRSSYSEGVTLDSWKESGAIEYSCDVLLGLQPEGMRDTVDKASGVRQKRDTEKAMRKHKAGQERACELVVLKNRNGATPEDGIPLTFKPLSALYVEGEQPKEQAARHMI